ncbi:hypothetical protein SDC9_71960 [bioreactor metagenome]|uniref:Uncharacterized protein n=1 Tax=bioreactor metagenome TaxID=1076179 RepID=A0A644YA76_9ZZZZ
MITGNNDFYGFFEVTLNDILASHFDGTQSSFVDDVSQLGAGSAAGRSCNGIEVDAFAQLDISGMHTQNSFASLEVWQFYRYAPVETSRTQECLIKCFRSVGRS